ncbi:hypothetical protein RRG08_053991 [Elysia crispata]|uniref:Uncharacterized protein n=1 Tax=Elysia crispata TaxID=231223 RepID=A0AAE1BBL0_9GAST|nr:hypothetical protein RRG08_053991 [Elysia crispata]
MERGKELVRITRSILRLPGTPYSRHSLILILCHEAQRTPSGPTQPAGDPEIKDCLFYASLCSTMLAHSRLLQFVLCIAVLDHASTFTSLTEVAERYNPKGWRGCRTVHPQRLERLQNGTPPKVGEVAERYTPKVGEVAERYTPKRLERLQNGTPPKVGEVAERYTPKGWRGCRTVHPQRLERLQNGTPPKVGEVAERYNPKGWRGCRTVHPQRLERLQNGTTPKVGEVAEGGELEVSPSYPNPAQQESVEKKKPIECG